MLRVTEDSLGITIFEKTEYGAPTDNDDFHKIFLYGIFDSTTILQNKNFTLHLFTNKPETFQDFQPVTSFEILVKEDRSFLFEKFVALEPGLYYYLVEEKESKIIYFVDKFVVYDF